MVKFENKETAAQFEALTDHDLMVSKPQIYKTGPLSKIPPAMAEAMVQQKSNLIKRKDPKPEEQKAEATKVEDPKGADGKTNNAKASQAAANNTN